MRKFNTRLFAGLLAVFCCMTALSATAYADGGYYEQSEDGSETPPSSIDSITISTESVRLPEQQGSEALTPDGNLTLIDDILQSAPYASVEEAAENKQFITVQSKNGNYFYIVIDRSGDTENVYFLNLVDEADLMALMEDSGSAAACFSSSSVSNSLMSLAKSSSSAGSWVSVMPLTFTWKTASLPASSFA